ncbi:MAG: SUMF1/EgtB/PvdO family nonheme iron enzyme [Myxococcales bacterium]|nr:SUMF1/EgtB/PvdO family nonheme iron enzyme [Myxococcales bacterium]
MAAGPLLSYIEGMLLGIAPRIRAPLVVFLASGLAAAVAVASPLDPRSRRAKGLLADRAARLQPQAVVRIEAGWFLMGSDGEDLAFASRLCSQGLPVEVCQPQAFSSELPLRRVYVGAFAIDRTEVSRGAYRRCELDHGCTPAGVSEADPRVGQAAQPVVFVSAADAERYCRWAGGRLPTEAEWERAARGGSRRRFPWGRQYNSRVANHGTFTGEPDPIDGYTYAAPVSGFSDGRSAHGLLNMAGNVWEWTADRFLPDYYQHAPAVDPRGPSQGVLRVIRGGSWRSPPHELRAAARVGLGPADVRPDVGFRCAY